ncbi:sensor histidine kinase [uncultured Piscinibacter sp.]|uniref:sensor histidine kinase n=1 Tax=uncultured Piscinibacter sp. TaxID=1131835 RepID=UPI0026349359|nr:histidine kinase [uncultured Piscinibacter sp.]
MAATPDSAAPTERAFDRFIAALSLRRVLIAIVLAVAAASLLNPVFVTPYPVLLGRMLVIALMLLLVFTAAGSVSVGQAPRWLVQVIAVVLAAPVATYVVYLPAVQGQVFEVLRHEGRLSGFVLITGTVLVIAPLLALGALYRERDAQARNQALSFALERSQLERQALDARLRLLHAQIEPHFLFNTLANIQALVESGSPQASAVLKSLIAYLRAAMPRLGDDNATLGNELALVRAYLELMLMRMPDRLAFEIDVPAELHGQRFPAMALLTLVENAIRHGVDPAEAGGRIVVRARREADDSLTLSVADTGVGLSENAAPGTGLVNLRERLAMFFGAAARLEMVENEPSGVVVTLNCPRQVAR